jgi:hypothetical protein
VLPAKSLIINIFYRVSRFFAVFGGITGHAEDLTEQTRLKSNPEAAIIALMHRLAFSSSFSIGYLI